MELKRASLIQNTPPSTPRNSMLLVPPQTTGSNSSSQMFNLQEFLTRFDPEDTPGMIGEMEETDSQQHVRSTDLRHRGEMSNIHLPGQQHKKIKKSDRKSLQPVSSRSQECLQEENESGSDESFV
jgi:hypothetical protein